MLCSNDPKHGFQFPGVFELAAMGLADRQLDIVLPQLLRELGIEVVQDAVTCRLSSNGRFVSVRIMFHASSREEYERAHQALREHPEVKWTL